MNNELLEVPYCLGFYDGKTAIEVVRKVVTTESALDDFKSGKKSVLQQAIEEDANPVSSAVCLALFELGFTAPDTFVDVESAEMIGGYLH